MRTELRIGEAVLSLRQGDITQQDTDAIVNAANSSLMGGGGVDGAIHRAAGPRLLEECKEIVARQGRLPPGQAVITSGGNLKARHVIHTVGPIYRNRPSDPETLASCYTESLRLAEEHGLRSVAFPSISTGAYGYPVREAAPVALRAIVSFLKQGPGHVRDVRMVLFDEATFRAYAEALEDLARQEGL